MNWIRVSGPLCINLDRVNMVAFEPMTEVCTITWATGDAPLEFQGQKALEFMGALDQYPFIQVDGIWMGQDSENGDTKDYVSQLIDPF
jgi:hypothetical protein